MTKFLNLNFYFILFLILDMLELVVNSINTRIRGHQLYRHLSQLPWLTTQGRHLSFRIKITCLLLQVQQHLSKFCIYSKFMLLFLELYRKNYSYVHQVLTSQSAGRLAGRLLLVIGRRPIVRRHHNKPSLLPLHGLLYHFFCEHNKRHMIFSHVPKD